MPTIDIPDKICPHCGGTKWIIQTDKYTKKDGTVSLSTWYQCHKKNYDYSKKTRAKNPEKYRNINSKASSKRRKTEEFKQWNSVYQKKLVSNLYPLYLARLIAKYTNELNWRDIPQEIIEIKRKEILLKRQMNNHENKNMWPL
jgi:hypothetical protein